jgi:[acyl-carrier-protein] S-malonyltransferase
MGAPWRGHAAWEVVTRAEDALGRSLEPLLMESPLDHTEDAQLAILLVSLMAWEAARPELEAPVAVAGHSLGQVTALIAAGALGFEAGLGLAAERARLTQAAANRTPGGMAALLGASQEQLDAAMAAGAGKCWIANDNAPGQVVLAGTTEGLDAAVAGARAAGVRKVMPLAVDGAFHTPMMEEARAGLAAHLADVPFSSPVVPVVSNEDATPYTDGDGWRVRLADHVVRPVRWRDSVAAMVELGADALIEVGPGRTLAGMARRIVPDIPAAAAPAPTLEVTP